MLEYKTFISLIIFLITIPIAGFTTRRKYYIQSTSLYNISNDAHILLKEMSLIEKNNEYYIHRGDTNKNDALEELIENQLIKLHKHGFMPVEGSKDKKVYQMHYKITWKGKKIQNL